MEPHEQISRGPLTAAAEKVREIDAGLRAKNIREGRQRIAVAAGMTAVGTVAYYMGLDAEGIRKVVDMGIAEADALWGLHLLSSGLRQQITEATPR